METGPRFMAPSDRLEKPGIEPVTPCYNIPGSMAPSQHDVTPHLTNEQVHPFGRQTRIHYVSSFEPPHGKTNNLHRRKQRRRSASR